MTTTPPDIVKYASWLIIAAVLMSIASYFYNFDFLFQLGMSRVQSNPNGVPPSVDSVKTSSLISAVIGFVFYAWIAYKIYQGRNWARIIFLLLVLLNVVVFIVNPTMPKQLLQHSVIGFILLILPQICNVIAVIILFTSGSTWFKKQREPAA